MPWRTYCLGKQLSRHNSTVLSNPEKPRFCDITITFAQIAYLNVPFPLCLSVVTSFLDPKGSWFTTTYACLSLTAVTRTRPQRHRMFCNGIFLGFKNAPRRNLLLCDGTKALRNRI